ncbi:uncharacterized protein K441DRAFT_662958 [Cenococcum geophilum 1.58]|uniref:uncharacterized protein n=1 Tax=Cenococcum geophilum 1.58 TaxID=794803 RepID=UPI00358F31D1|nr:hypothetical protein K441DRAFT_662958 [Cenococcum geophilum 1.58]
MTTTNMLNPSTAVSSSSISTSMPTTSSTSSSIPIMPSSTFSGQVQADLHQP